MSLAAKIALSLAPPLSFALTAKGGRFDGESETFVFQTRGGDLSTGHDVAGTLGSNCDRASGGAPMVAHSLRGEGFDASEDGTGRGTPLVPTYSICGASDPLWAMELAQPSTTRNGDPGMITGRCGVRRLMPVECERCQGMPDHWTRYGIDDKGNEHELSDSARYRLIGNSVAVPNVEWIGRRIVAASEQH